MGRPQVLDVGSQQTLLALMTVGISQRQAALLVGCDPSTVAKLAAREEGFRDRLCEARRQAEYRPLERLARQSEHSWRANVWLLERTMPEKYGSAAERQSSKKAAEQAVTDLLQMVLEEVSDPLAQERIARRAEALIGKPIGPLSQPTEVAKPSVESTRSESDVNREVSQAGSAERVEPKAPGSGAPERPVPPPSKPAMVLSQPETEMNPPVVPVRTHRQRRAERRLAAQNARRQREMETVVKRRNTLLDDPPLWIAGPRSVLPHKAK